MTKKDSVRSMFMTRRSVAAGSLVGLGALVGSTAILKSQLSVLAEDEEPAFSYEGDTGPENWGDLSEDYETCSIGESQSPVDIAAASEEDIANVTVDYKTVSPMRIINNGHSVQVNIDEGSTATIDGVVYNLKQFHFHSPSEHTIDGEHQAMELHLVHGSDDGASAVLSVMLREGEANEALEPVFSNFPTEPGDEVPIDVTVDPAAFLPASALTYRYSGSLTTPPCTEGINWVVMAEPVEISADQIALFPYDGNNRPLQELNDREIDVDSTE